MTEKVKAFWSQNFSAILIFVVNIAFFIGMYYGVFRTQLDAKVTKEEVRQIVREEIESKFSVTDGKVLENNFRNLNEKLDKLEALMQQHIITHK